MRTLQKKRTLNGLIQEYFGSWLRLRPRCGLLALVRAYPRWRKSVSRGVDTVTLRLPWINYAAIDCLAERLRPGDRVFEYGCGGSTLFFLDLGLRVISVEHEEEWLSRVRELANTGDAATAWQGFLRQPRAGAGVPSPRDLADIDGYRSANRRFAEFSFEDYAGAIDTFPDAHFDLVLVDGRARPSCVKHSARKVRPGGLLLLDNTERSYYLDRSPACLPGWRKVLDSFGPTPTQSHFTRCTVWQRPRQAFTEHDPMP